MHFLCKVPSTVKFPKFPRTTALQRCKLFCHSTQLRGDRRRDVARLFPFHQFLHPFIGLTVVWKSQKVMDVLRQIRKYRHRLSANPVCEPARTRQHPRRNNIHGAPKHARYSIFDCDIIAKAHVGFELHKKIDIAIRALLFAGARTEHPKLFGFVLAGDRVDFIPLRPYFVKHAHLYFPTGCQYYTKSPPSPSRRKCRKVSKAANAYRDVRLTTSLCRRCYIVM